MSFRLDLQTSRFNGNELFLLRFFRILMNRFSVEIFKNSYQIIKIIILDTLHSCLSVVPNGNTKPFKMDQKIYGCAVFYKRQRQAFLLLSLVLSDTPGINVGTRNVRYN
jgi:hypothetical protein